jgi:hypothetical protein
MKVIYSESGRDTLIASTERMLKEAESVRYLDGTGQSTIEEYTVKINAEYSKRIETHLKASYKINIIGLGDVGGNVLLGLKLLGGKTIDEIGIFNPDVLTSKRYELEMNQIYSENFDMAMPVKIVDEERLFDADVVVFTASKSVPLVGDEQVDVRKIQFADNSKIIQYYVKQAVVAEFKGLFLVVSDPVDLLCKVAYDAADGAFLPSQIAGFGQGVMYARARYYATEMGLKSFEKEGRIFGPHGSELVVANSIVNYDDVISRKLTDLTVKANLEIRACGFKPYIAPAFSSGALSIISYLRGQNVYTSQYLGGYFFGLYGKITNDGLSIETNQIPEELMKRIEKSYQEMMNYYECNRIDS